jgi:hypothetical protein
MGDGGKRREGASQPIEGVSTAKKEQYRGPSRLYRKKESRGSLKEDELLGSTIRK